MKKKLILIITVLSLLISVLPLSLVNVSALVQTTFVVESVTKQESSSTVDVNIIVQNNPGIAGATLSIYYSDGLTLVEASNGEAFSDLILTKPGILNNNCRFLWDSVDGETTKDGVMLILTFEVASDATGDLVVGISCNDGDIYNDNFDNVEVQTVNGVVRTSSINDNTDSFDPTFEVQSAFISENASIVYVDILVKNNPGIAGAVLNVKYTKGLKLVSATNGSAFSNLSLTVPGQFSNPCRFLWDSISGQSTSNGTILTLSFEVLSETTGDFEIEIYCNNGDVYNENLDTVEIKTVNGVIKTETDSDDTSDIYEPIVEVKSVANVQTSSTINVDIIIKNNPGIAGATLNVKYADSLTLISASNGTAFSDLTLTVPGQYSNPCRFLWDSISGETKTDGIILTLTFKVSDSATGVLNVEIYCDDGDVYNENTDTINIKTKNGKITVIGENYLFAKGDNTAVVDYNSYFITGLKSNLSSLDEYIYVAEGYVFDNRLLIGTGCVVNVKQSDTIVERYTVIIFGDVNGDGWYDGQDAVTVSMIAGGMLTREQVGEAVWMAADCNHDGVIDQADVELLNQAGVLLSNVDQTKSSEELIETSAEYVEYLNLIDQQTDADSDEAPEDNTEENEEPTESSLWNIIVKYFVELIKKFLSVIKVF